MRLRRLVDKILKRHWTEELINKYIGKHESSWLLYAADDEIRGNAASGGTVTGLLNYLLIKGEIDGALVLKSYIEANELNTRYEIVTSRNELISAQGSKYITTNFTRDAIPLIKSFPGRLAIVLLPCDTWVLSRLLRNDKNVEKKVVLRIALFCGHISDPGLTRMVIQKEKPSGISLTDFRYRQGHWRGEIRFDFENNTSTKMPFSSFSDYQNLYFYCARKCLSCFDHTGYDSDMSVGDVWLMAMKYDPIKHNALIARNSQAQKFIADALSSGHLIGKQVPIEYIAEAQSRSLPLHYNVSARSIAGNLIRLKIGDTVHERVRAVDLIVALLITLNYSVTTSTYGRAFLRVVPKPVIKLYLYALKALEIL